MFEPLFIIDMLLTTAAMVAAGIAGRQAGRLPGRAGDDTSPVPRRLRRALYVTAALLTARVAVAGLLFTGGWQLAGTRFIVGLPIAVLPLVWAIVEARRLSPAVPSGAAVMAGYTAMAGALISGYWQFVPPGPHDTFGVLAVSLLLLGGAAGASRLLARRRGAAPGGTRSLSRAPWPTVAVLAVLALALGSAYQAGAATADTGQAGHTGLMDWGGGPVPGNSSHHGTAGAVGSSVPGNPQSHGAAGAVGGSVPGDSPHGAARSVDQLTGPRDATPDVRVTLTAARTTLRLASGRQIDAATFNGQSPGPQIRVRQGRLIEVTLVNADIEEGVTVHWHGVDVPNAEDGVPGVTQDAVMPGGRHVYRFVPDRAGTFWYHTHLSSADLVQRGLFGALIVDPADGTAPAPPFEQTVFAHLWPAAGNGTSKIEGDGGTSNGTGERDGGGGRIAAFGTADTPRRQAVPAGKPASLRLINSSEEPQRLMLDGTPFIVTAVDGNTIDRPTSLADGTDLLLPAGGRIDVAFVMPSATVTLRIDGTETPNDAALAFSPSGTADPADRGQGTLFDPIAYGAPSGVALQDERRFDRTFDLVLDNGFGFFNGGFTYANTINGRLYPAIPTLMVTEGDRVRMRIANRSLMDHPMHLHGHRVLVLSRNGVPVTGSPWWTDSLNMAPGETFEVAFTADNPGVWMDHCHNFSHAAEGMIMHLAYTGVTTPYHANHAPE